MSLTSNPTGTEGPFDDSPGHGYYDPPGLMPEAADLLDDTVNPDKLKAIAEFKLKILECRRSPLALYQHMCRDEEGKPVIIKWFHKEWEQMILHYPRVLIEASRGLSKTSFMLYAVLWAIGRNVNIRIKWLGENDSNATKRLAVIHNVVDHSAFYQLVFPHVRKTADRKRPNTSTMLNLERDFITPEPTVEASGILSAGTGGRSDLIILDDIVGETNAILNPAYKPKVLSKLQSDWMGTLVPKGRIWGVFSPWAKDDANEVMKIKHGWTHRKYAHGKPGDPYHSIFEELWPREKLYALRGDLGEIIYARAYNCQLMAKGTVVIQPEYLRHYHPRLLTPEKVSGAIAVISGDPSSGRELNRGRLDYFGVTVLLYVPHPYGQDKQPSYEIFIPEAFQARIPTTQQPLFLWDLVRKWGAQYLLVESHGMQTLAEWIYLDPEKDPTIAMTEVHPVSFGSISKGQRLTMAAPILGRPEGQPPVVYFHPKTVDPRPQTEVITLSDGSQWEILRTLRDQLLSFPTTHDDVADSFTQGALWVYRNLASQLSTDSGDKAETEDSSVSAISI